VPGPLPGPHVPELALGLDPREHVLLDALLA
jgi:hypothetical protein